MLSRWLAGTKAGQEESHGVGVVGVEAPAVLHAWVIRLIFPLVESWAVREIQRNRFDRRRPLVEQMLDNRLIFQRIIRAGSVQQRPARGQQIESSY